MTAAANQKRIRYQPALDGVRAIAVIMVLLFHGDVAWMRGGYFGVSIFFTLSGFLITSLLRAEFAESGRVAVGAFYTRRVRRLLPASLVCLAVVSTLGVFEVWKGADHLRRDVLGALFQVANWVQLFAGESYTDLQSKNAGLQSPLAHYWSLAIEEQFYWIWPLVFWALARFARRRRRSLVGVVGAITLILAVAAPLIALVFGRDAAYWATPARAAEILIGATLALACAAGTVTARRWMAPVGLVVVIVLAVVLPGAGGPAYHGAFPVLALATALLLLGLQAPGAVTTLLAVRALVAIGAISYGLYLYHFPAFVLLSEARTGLSGASLLALRLGVTVAVSLVSYWLIERPIRHSDLSGVRSAVWTGVATVGVCALVIALPSSSAATYYEPDPELAAQVGISPVADDSVPPLIATPTPTPSTASDGSASSSTDDSIESDTTAEPTDVTDTADRKSVV